MLVGSLLFFFAVPCCQVSFLSCGTNLVPLYLCATELNHWGLDFSPMHLCGALHPGAVFYPWKGVVPRVPSTHSHIHAACGSQLAEDSGPRFFAIEREKGRSKHRTLDTAPIQVSQAAFTVIKLYHEFSFV